MIRTKTAKIFRNGASQAVRLPAEFRIDAEEVYVRRDEETGDVILSSRPGAHVWKEFFNFARSIQMPAGFLDRRPLNIPRKNRDLFRDGGK